MLVLQRKIGESVSIDRGRILVTVLEVQKNRVRLGFRATSDVPIMRVEIEDWDGQSVTAAIAGEEHEEAEEEGGGSGSDGANESHSVRDRPEATD